MNQFVECVRHPDDERSRRFYRFLGKQENLVEIAKPLVKARDLIQDLAQIVPDDVVDRLQQTDKLCEKQLSLYWPGDHQRNDEHKYEAKDQSLAEDEGVKKNHRDVFHFSIPSRREFQDNLLAPLVKGEYSLLLQSAFGKGVDFTRQFFRQRR